LGVKKGVLSLPCAIDGVTSGADFTGDQKSPFFDSFYHNINGLAWSDPRRFGFGLHYKFFITNSYAFRPFCIVLVRAIF
jgi:hypothetical protein